MAGSISILKSKYIYIFLFNHRNQNVSYGIAFGGLLSLIGNYFSKNVFLIFPACLFIFLIDTKNEKDEKEDETSPLLKENEN